MTEEKSSRISGFYKFSLEDKLRKIKEFAELSEDDLTILKKTFISDVLPYDKANTMIENVVGLLPVTLGVATNFRINGKDYLIPMAIEEASVIAAASNSAKMTRSTGGFFVSATDPIMIGQIQVVNLDDPEAARLKILEIKDKLLKHANDQDPILVKFGGGAKDLRTRVVYASTGPMVIAELLVDCRDAMGANAVNTMCEAIAPLIEEITEGKVLLRILSNLADLRLVRARCLIEKEVIGGEDVVDGIIQAFAFAEADPYRAATHNKGVMNGIDAVALAVGQDWRAIEAGVHAYASMSGEYTSITYWEKTKDGNLAGSIEIPMAVGLVGGIIRNHPIAQISKKILGVTTATELAEVIVVVGLAQNFGAIRALATTGIQKGHMKLHARNLVSSVGAKVDEIEGVVEILLKMDRVNYSNAQEALKKHRESKS